MKAGIFNIERRFVCSDELMASIPYCIQLMEGPYIETNPDVVEAFRPKSARR